MTRTSGTPQRSCLGCRKTFDQNDLIRYALTPQGMVVPDVRRRLPGRGAYTCWSPLCLAHAVQRRQFDRAFRQPCQALQDDRLLADILKALRARMLGLIGMGRKSSQLVAGSNAVLDALGRPRQIDLLVLASDISAGIAEKVSRKAARVEVKCLGMFSKIELGPLTGRAETSALAIYQGKLAEAFAADLQNYRKLSGES